MTSNNSMLIYNITAKNVLNRILFLLLLFLPFCNVYPQQEINNYITDFLKDKVVVSFAVDSNTLWAYDGHLFYRFSDNKIKTYNFDSTSEGLIRNYEFTGDITKETETYAKLEMYRGHLFVNLGNNLLDIFNEKISRINPVNLNHLTFYSFLNNGNSYDLFLIKSEFKFSIGNSHFISELLSYQNGIFSKYCIAADTNFNIIDLIKNDSTIYFLTIDKDYYYNLNIFNEKNKSFSKYKLDIDADYHNKKLFMDKDNLYITNVSGDFYIYNLIEKKLSKETFTLVFRSPGEDFSFTVRNKVLYFSNHLQFLIYDLNKHSQIKNIFYDSKSGFMNEGMFYSNYFYYSISSEYISTMSMIPSIHIKGFRIINLDSIKISF